MPRRKSTEPVAAEFDAGAGVDNRAPYLQRREHDRFCRIHKVLLDEQGFCAVAQAWWWPRFACPHCRGWLWENGFCPNCTPQLKIFPGDYFEERFDGLAGREWGHYVRVHRGPTPVMDAPRIEFPPEDPDIPPSEHRAVAAWPF